MKTIFYFIFFSLFMFTSCISSHDDNNTKYKSSETESKTINQNNNTEQKIYIDVRTQEEWDT